MKPTFFIFLLLINMLPISAQASSVLPLDLQQLSTRASLIFYGEAVSNSVEKDEQSGYIVTFTRFRIIDLIKGDTGDTDAYYTIKQIGGHLKGSDGGYGTTLRVHGIPAFQTGDKYVVFLPERSALGFSSPLGLHQGRFSVRTIDDQQVVSNGDMAEPVTNGAGNRTGSGASRLQLPLAVDVEKPSQSNLSDFINTVRAYNAPN